MHTWFVCLVRHLSQFVRVWQGGLGCDRGWMGGGVRNSVGRVQSQGDGEPCSSMASGMAGNLWMFCPRIVSLHTCAALTAVSSLQLTPSHPCPLQQHHSGVGHQHRRRHGGGCGCAASGRTARVDTPAGVCGPRHHQSINQPTCTCFAQRWRPPHPHPPRPCALTVAAGHGHAGVSGGEWVLARPKRYRQPAAVW